MTNSNKILYSVSGNIAILTINRPERRNALDAETLEQINILLDRAESDEKVRVILIIFIQANTRVRGPAVLFCPYYATDTPYNPAGGSKGTHEVHCPHLLVPGVPANKNSPSGSP